MKSRFSLMMSAAVAVCALAASGCSAVGAVLESANGGLTGLAVTQAAARYIAGAGDETAQYARAQRVKAVVSELRAAADGQLVTVASLRALAEAQLPADMTIPDRLLATEVINVAALALEERYGSGPIGDVDLPNLDALLRRIEFAAAYFPAPS